MRLEARDLTLAYDRAPVIEALNLRFPARKVTAVVGPNGCGKSTLLRGLARLLKPRTGTVLLDDVPIDRLSTREVARRLAVLPQRPVAPEGLRVRELVAQGRYPHQGLFRQWTEGDERAVERALEITRTTELGDRPLETLSGGQQQRAWIAMVLAQETGLLLLDEPTTFLDVAHQVEVLDLLDELNERDGRTILMVLHDINHACRYADHLVVMKEGRVVAHGEPRDLVNARLIREVFGLPCRVLPDPVTGTPWCVPLDRRTPGGRTAAAGPDPVPLELDPVEHRSGG